MMIMFGVFASLFLLGGKLEHLTCLDIKVERDIALQVADPFVVAGKEGTILVLIGGQGLESGTCVALLIADELLGHMVANKRLQQVKLEIILLVEFMARHRLRVCVVIALIAAIS